MFRILCLLLAFTCAAGAQAAVISQFDHEVRLRAYETVRYRLNIDFGTASVASVDVVVRGFNVPPRVRVLDSRKKEMRDVRDRDGDWKLDFDFNASTEHTTYFIEVDSANPGDRADLDVLITVHADQFADASADVKIDRYFIDRESGDDSDHYDCAARPGAGLWALLPLGPLVLLAARRRRAAA